MGEDCRYRGGRLAAALPTAAGRELTRHPCQGAAQQLGVAAGLSLKTRGLRDCGSYTATWVSRAPTC